MQEFKIFPGVKPPDPYLQRAAASNAARGRRRRLTTPSGGGVEGGEGRGEGKGLAALLITDSGQW